MTVRELIRKIMDTVDDVNEEIEIYISAKKIDLKEWYEGAREDDDYVLDDFLDIKGIHSRRLDDKRTAWYIDTEGFENL